VGRGIPFGQGDGRNLAIHWDGEAWSAIKTPNVGPGQNNLIAVEALSPDDAWAVGFDYSGSLQVILAAHWDGHDWSLVPTADSLGGDEQLHAVTALGPDDVWAVGDDLPRDRHGPVDPHRWALGRFAMDLLRGADHPGHRAAVRRDLAVERPRVGGG
jgi:hypothetical protein